MNPKQVTQSLSNSLARLYSLQAVVARFGIGRLLVKLPGIAPSMPPDEEAYYPLYIRPQSLQASAKEYQGLPASAAEAAAVKSFDGLPLIVLTAKLNDNPGWPEWHNELRQLSSNSEHLFVENSGHVIQIDQSPSLEFSRWFSKSAANESPYYFNNLYYGANHIHPFRSSTPSYSYRMV